MRRLGAGFLPLGTFSSLLHRLPSCFVIAAPLFLLTLLCPFLPGLLDPFTLFCVLCQHSPHCQTVRLSSGSKVGLVRPYERAIKLSSYVLPPPLLKYSLYFQTLQFGTVSLANGDIYHLFPSLNCCSTFLLFQILFACRIFASSFPCNILYKRFKWSKEPDQIR